MSLSLEPASKAEIIARMRSWFLNPAGQHHDPYFAMKWGEGVLPGDIVGMRVPLLAADLVFTSLLDDQNFLLAAFAETVMRNSPRWDDEAEDE